MAKFTRVFPGNASLAESQRACKVEQQDETAKLTGLEPALFKRPDGTESKVNVADFSTTPITQILNELKFVDVSTPQGASDAAALNQTHTRMFRCKMFVADQLKDIEVFGKKSS
jgi:hypothetical protein